MHSRNNYDFLRMFLAALVIVSHSYQMVLGPYEAPQFGGTSLGVLAVNAFFAISGYLITVSWMRSKSVSDYFTKRLLRIYPAFIVTCTVCLIIVLPIASPDGLLAIASIEPASLWRIAFLAFPDAPEPFVGHHFTNLNMSLWTIKFEFCCYIGLAVLFSLGLLRVKPLLLVLFIVSLLLVLALPYLEGETASGLRYKMCVLVKLMPFFLAGMIFALYKDRIPIKSWIAAAALGLTFAGGFSHLASLLLLPTAFVYVVFWFGECGWSKLNGFGKYGAFSYGTYLYGWPIQQLTVMWLGELMTPLLLIAVSLPLSILAGVVSFHVVEKPFIKRANRKAAAIHNEPVAIATQPVV